MVSISHWGMFDAPMVSDEMSALGFSQEYTGVFAVNAGPYIYTGHALGSDVETTYQRLNFGRLD